MGEQAGDEVIAGRGQPELVARVEQVARPGCRRS